jgi:putative flippase GtrA
MERRLARLLGDKKVKYLLTGGGSFIFEYGSFLLLMWAFHMLVFANVISFIVGLLVSFYIQHAWTFKTDYKHTKRRQFASYLTLALINIVLTSQVVYALVTFIGMAPALAKIVSMALMVTWNFAILNRVIFRRADT